jgi:predicted DNA-binding transcriptional regulator YafY
MILNYRLKPVRLVNSDFNWILLGIKEGESITKSFYVSRIENLIYHDESFMPITESASKKKLYEITLRFNPEVEDEVLDKIWFDDFTLKKDSKRFIILKTNQEISNRLAAWCLSWWDMIKIIKPKRLKEYTTEMIQAYRISNKV